MDIFVARQPIFDANEELVGYELLYRSNASTTHAAGVSTMQMSIDILVHAFLEMGIDRLTHGVPAFVNFPTGMLAQQNYKLLDPRSVVIEILETVECNDETLKICEEMVSLGYRIALDDFVLEESRIPFLDFAEVVKVDVLGRPNEEIAMVAEKLRAHDVRLLAERVEDAAMLATCRSVGFELFQGYHFARPETVSKREIPVGQLQTIRLMNLLYDTETTDSQIEEELRANLPVSYRLLRIATSASVGGRGTQSIQHAVQLVGRGALYRWLGLVLVSSVSTDSGAGVERVYTALRYARMCELLAMRAGHKAAAGPLFMVGLLSQLDTLLRVSMSEIVEQLDLAADVRAALLHEGGPYAEPLHLVEAYDRGCWDDVIRIAESMKISPDTLPDIYIEALAWAREHLPLARP